MSNGMTGFGDGRRYGYAVGRSDLLLPEGVIGVEDAPLEKLVIGSVCLVMSPTEAETLRPQRKHLSAHYRILSELSNRGDVLPMAFGIIFDNVDGAQRMLSDNEKMLSNQLSAIAGSVEMGLRLRWEGVDVFSVVVDMHPELKEMRDRCFAGGTPKQNDLLDLGQAFEAKLNEDRDQRQDVVLATLRSVASDIRVLPLQGENASVNLACLVRRSDLPEFDKAVDALAKVFDDHHMLEIDGPLPPFNFVDVRI